MKTAPLKTGPWRLTDLKDIPKNGKTVFSIFHCGGGSTMGYKLAGFEVLGGVEIDPQMMAIYRANHNPKHSFLMGVQDFNKIPRDQIPKELFDLDILDGSPPCSSFSMAGSREKAWGKKKKFREGQADQVLDDLFFHFIETAKILQPKVVIAENVKGLLMGKAKGYVKQIAQQFDLIGYDLQLFLLNAAFMGVPQRRERSFFVAKKKSIALQKLSLKFNENTISIKEVCENIEGKQIKDAKTIRIFRFVNPGQDFRCVAEKVFGKRSVLKQKINRNGPLQTHTATTRLVSDKRCCEISDQAVVRGQSFPDDFNFLNQETVYVCGMSVPPFMMQRVADQVYKQWLSKDS